MCEDFAPNFADKELAVTSRQRIVSHFLFHQGFFFAKTNMTALSLPPYFRLFLRLKMKRKGSHFDPIEVIETESQAVLNAWDAQTHCERCILAEGDYFEGDGSQ
jgi:hypothetical protein